MDGNDERTGAPSVATGTSGKQEGSKNESLTNGEALRLEARELLRRFSERYIRTDPEKIDRYTAFHRKLGSPDRWDSCTDGQVRALMAMIRFLLGEGGFDAVTMQVLDILD